MTKKALLVVISLFFLLGISWAKDQKVPYDIKFYTARGEELSFKDLKGKVLLVNFFATYCPPCQVELVEFTELYRKLHSKGLEIVSFMVDRGGEFLLPRIIRSRGIEYYVAVADDTILSAFGWPDLLPTTFVVDREGRIVRKIVGFAGKKTLEQEVMALLEHQG